MLLVDEKSGSTKSSIEKSLLCQNTWHFMLKSLKSDDDKRDWEYSCEYRTHFR